MPQRRGNSRRLPASKLNRAILVLENTGGGSSRARLSGRRTMSQEARNRIAESLRRRWAKVRGATAKWKRTLSPAARPRIIAAQKARWAKFRATETGDCSSNGSAWLPIAVKTDLRSKSCSNLRRRESNHCEKSWSIGSLHRYCSMHSFSGSLAALQDLDFSGTCVRLDLVERRPGLPFDNVHFGFAAGF